MDSAPVPGGNVALLRDYETHLRVERGLRPLSCAAYRRDLILFAEFGEQTSATLLTADTACARGFLQHLREHGMESRTVARKLSCLRGFYRWLLRDKRIAADPTLHLESPQIWKVLPKSLPQTDIRTMLETTGAAARAADAGGIALRDHALVELLYAAGLRFLYVTGIKDLYMFVFVGSVLVRGKGDKERIDLP